MRAKVILFFAPLLGLLCSAAEGRAGMINWTADWTQSTNVVGANGGAMSGGVTFASPPTGTIQTGNATITAEILSTFTSATSGNPDLFNAAPYTLKVNLTDLASNQSSLLTFTGSLTGSQSTTSATFTNTFNSPTTLSTQIGGNDYTVSLFSFMAPGPATTPGGSPVLGNIMAQVNVQAASTGGGGSTGTGGGGGTGTPLSTPEPASLVLAGLGTSLFGLLRWRRPTGVQLAL
jgi:hypothetical protein